jgi:predicted AlkP superfamily phosphohydrolase/phosphomutase
MRVFVLGLDGATWEILQPLMAEGRLPHLARVAEQGVSGVLESVYPPLSPVAWTTLMTGKNPGRHGIFEFLEFGHDPERPRVNSSRTVHSEYVWQVAERAGKQAVVGGVPLSYPPRAMKGFFLGDFLSPADAKDFANDAGIYQELEAALGEPYRPWSTAVHDGGREEEVLKDLTAFLDQHLRAVEFLAERSPWDLFVFDLMATDRIQHELWHAWEPSHRAGRGRDLSAIRAGFVGFWEKLDAGVGRILERLPSDTAVLLISDHGFGPIEWYVNFNVWLLQEGYLALQPSWYVRQKRWFYERGVTPEWFYGVMTKFGLGQNRLTRFRGKQINALDRIADHMFLSRKHIDWGKTRAYAQGNFGQIFLNLKGRQPRGCVAPEEARGVLDELKGRLLQLKHPETGEPLVSRVYEREELYEGPYTAMAPDLTVVPGDWRCRTIGLYDFTTNQVVSPSFGPTGDHRLEGVLFAAGAGIRQGAKLRSANLADIAPTVLRLLGVPVPGDMDGRILEEILDPGVLSGPGTAASDRSGGTDQPVGDGGGGEAEGYTPEEEAVIQQRLAELGYL